MLREIEPECGFYDSLKLQYVLVLECGHVVVLGRNEEIPANGKIDCIRCNSNEEK